MTGQLGVVGSCCPRPHRASPVLADPGFLDGSPHSHGEWGGSAPDVECSWGETPAHIGRPGFLYSLRGILDREAAGVHMSN
ncbi:hypothetical protein J6590_021686 [Homalodisca vitripennis]|nr:hypothetical protein J6590_021686 [Homalodisca vitripennis]